MIRTIGRKRTFPKNRPMKRLSFLSLAGIALALTSCTGDTTCTCVVDGNTTTTVCEGCSGDDLAEFEESCAVSDAVAQILGGECTID